MATHTAFLLDTNILLHFVRADVVWQRVKRRYQLFTATPKPIISIVTSAELRSIAGTRGWGPAKLSQMEYALGYFDEVPIEDRQMVDAYVLIDSHFQKQGRALGKNDLWIAATAHVMNACLLTTDLDFDAMDPLFIKREWIDPT